MNTLLMKNWTTASMSHVFWRFSKLFNKWLFASGGVLEFWCVWNQTIIYLCDDVLLTQWQLWCVIKWADMQNVYKVFEWWRHGNQSVLHVSSQVSSFSFMYTKLNKILHMRLHMEKMHGCVLLWLQQNIYEIRCCDIANKMCCANKNDYVIMYM